MKVIIDGVEYVPKVEIPEVSDVRLKCALQSLTEIQYFNIQHKNRAVAWIALHALAPDLAEMAANNPQAAYDLVHD